MVAYQERHVCDDVHAHVHDDCSSHFRLRDDGHDDRDRDGHDYRGDHVHEDLHVRLHVRRRLDRARQSSQTVILRVRDQTNHLPRLLMGHRDCDDRDRARDQLCHQFQTTLTRFRRS